MKKFLPIFLVIISLGYYWLVPFGKLLFQYAESSKSIVSIVSSVPDPVIEKIYILPSYEKNSEYIDCGPRPKCYEINFNIKEGKNTIVITGKNFKSIDYTSSQNPVNISVNGQVFSSYNSNSSSGSNKIATFGEYYAVQVTDNHIKFEVDSSLLSKQNNEITVTRDGKVSRTFSLTNDEVSHQLSLMQSNSPAIISAIPIDYPLNKYWSQGVDMIFIVTGFPTHYVLGAPEESTMCMIKIDGKSYDICYGDSTENLNIYYQQIELDKPSHELTLTVANATSLPFKFDTVQFEQISKQKQNVSNTYVKNVSNKNLVAGGLITLIGQSKNGSLPALGINLLLTLILVLFLRPWIFDGARRWVASFIIPVMLQALAGIILGVVLLGGDFVAPLAGSVIIWLSMYNAILPLIEGVIVAIILMYSIKHIRNVNPINNNPSNIS